jgi:hypothetical protein
LVVKCGNVGGAKAITAAVSRSGPRTRQSTVAQPNEEAAHGAVEDPVMDLAGYDLGIEEADIGDELIPVPLQIVMFAQRQDGT